MQRAAIYARYSTDLQSEKSVEDQTTLCRQYADQQGFKVVGLYDDKAISGASIHNRPGLRLMLHDMEAGRFDAIIVEELDRLSRDMEDLAGLYKKMTFLGVKIMAVHGGEANTITVGMRGLFGQLFREDNVHKVRRGMTGLVAKGLSAGGRAYGYRPVPGKTGELVIVEEEAEVVRRIFTDMAAGKSARAISQALNAEGVPAPRGLRWQTTGILGWAERGTGLIRNQIYRGVIVWNKVKMVKDPSTGKRLSRPNPESEWQSVEVPHLRIVSDELWEKAQPVSRPREKGGPQKFIRPKHLLTGLLRCGACGGGLHTKGKDKSGRVRIQCATHLTSKSCPAPQSFYLDTVELRTLNALTRELRDPEMFLEYARTYEAERKRLLKGMVSARVEAEKKLAKIQNQIQQLVRSISEGWAEPSVAGPESHRLAAERDRLKDQLSEMEDLKPTVTLMPSTMENYARALVGAKEQLLAGTLESNSEVAQALRNLVDSVTVYRDRDDPEGLTIKIKGHFDVFTSEAQDAPRKASGVMMVAEEGLEPPTRGL